MSYWSKQTARRQKSWTLKQTLLPSLYKIRGLTPSEMLDPNVEGDIESSTTGDRSASAPRIFWDRTLQLRRDTLFCLTWKVRCMHAVFYICEMVYQFTMVLAVVSGRKGYVIAALMGAFVGHVVFEGDFEGNVRRARGCWGQSKREKKRDPVEEVEMKAFGEREGGELVVGEGREEFAGEAGGVVR